MTRPEPVAKNHNGSQDSGEPGLKVLIMQFDGINEV
jgi:hypothetical protein